MSLTDDFEALANAYDVLSKDHDLTSHDRAFYAAVRDRIRVLLASHKEQSSPLRDDWEWLETKLSEWDGYQISVGLNILNHIKSVLSARKAALTAQESAKPEEKR